MNNAAIKKKHIPFHDTCQEYLGWQAKTWCLAGTDPALSLQAAPAYNNNSEK